MKQQQDDFKFRLPEYMIAKIKRQNDILNDARIILKKIISIK